VQASFLLTTASRAFNVQRGCLGGFSHVRVQETTILLKVAVMLFVARR